jgi:hypothetical protein
MATYSRSNHFGPYFQASFHNPPNTRTTALREFLVDRPLVPVSVLVRADELIE